jgi:hypothetical protein
MIVDVHLISARYRLCLKKKLGFKKHIFDAALAGASRWQYGLIAIGCFSSFLYPHIPLVSFATLAGITLNRRQAVASAGLIWLVNQLYGFTVRQYPLTSIAFLWGLTLGLGTVAVALMASMMPRVSPRSGLIRQGVGLIMTLMVGFVTFNSGIWLVNQWAGMHGLTADVLLRILGRDLGWAIGLFSLYHILNHAPVLPTQR